MDDNAIHQCQCPACLSDTDHPQRLLHEQMNLLLQRLDEQERRWVAGLESKKIGYGGDTVVACITGLPACGLPKMTSFVSRNSRPTRAASPLWSTTATRVIPRVRTSSSSRPTVPPTERGLVFVISPSTSGLFMDPRATD